MDTNLSILSTNSPISGYEVGKFNKIRDVDTFNIKDTTFSIVVDHRNHRLQIFKIIDNNFLFQQYLYKFNNIPLVLPGNVLSYHKKSENELYFITTEVKGLERIIFFSLIYHEDSGFFDMNVLDSYNYLSKSLTTEDSHGPGGPSIFGNLVIVPQYMTRNILILELKSSMDKIDNIFKYHGNDEVLYGPIDSCFTKHGILMIVDTMGLAGGKQAKNEITDKFKKNSSLSVDETKYQPNKIVLYNIKKKDNKPTLEYLDSYLDNFNFTHSGGAIDIDKNKMVFAVADTKNDKINIYHFGDKISKIFEFKNNDHFMFPTSINIMSDLRIIISGFHNQGKKEIRDFDKLLMYQLELGEMRNNNKDTVKCEMIESESECDTKVDNYGMRECTFKNGKCTDLSIIDKENFGIYQDGETDLENIDLSSEIIMKKFTEDEFLKEEDTVRMMEEIFLTSSIHISKRIESNILHNILDNLSKPPHNKIKEFTMDSKLYFQNIDILLTQINEIPNINTIKINDMVEKYELTSEKVNGTNDIKVYQYEQALQTTMTGWNLATLSSRGIVFQKHSDWDVIGIPFPKFWNTGDGWGVRSLKYDSDRAGVKISDLDTRLKDIGGTFYLEEKLDGSLGIIINLNGRWVVTTKGSFISIQAIKATLWIQQYGITFPNEKATYLCEIISPEDQIVVEYKNNIISLISGFDEYGYEIPEYELDIIVVNQKDNTNIVVLDKVVVSKSDLSTMNQTIEKYHDINADGKMVLCRPVKTDHIDINFKSVAELVRQWKMSEGVVAVWKYNNLTSYRTKIKSDYFVDSQQSLKNYDINECISEFIKGEESFNKWLINVDEEYYEYLKKVKLNLDKLFLKKVEQVASYLEIIKQFLEKSEQQIITEQIIKNDLLPEITDTSFINLLINITNRKKKDNKWQDVFRKVIIDLIPIEMIGDISEEDKEIIVKIDEPDKDLDINVHLTKVLNHIKTIHSDYQLNDQLKLLINYFEYYYNYDIIIVSEQPVTINIKYFESSKTWTKWSRQARGTVLTLIEDSFIVLQQLLERGVEVITQKHLNDSVLSTQDVTLEADKKPDFSIFTPEQQETMNDLLESETPLRGDLSMKVDGSLCAVNVFKKGTINYESIKKIYTQLPANNYLNLLIDSQDDDYLVNLSSQRKIILDSNYENFNWNLGAIIYGFLNQDTSTIQLSQDELMENYFFEQFNTKIIEFCKELESQGLWDRGSVSLIFESVCPNRVSIDGEIKNFLSISYDKFMFRFLGVTFNIGDTPGTFLPHCNDIIQNVLKKVRKKDDLFDWEEPLFWKLDGKPKKYLTDILIDLECVINGGIIPDYLPFDTLTITKTVNDFLNKYKPDNEYMSKKGELYIDLPLDNKYYQQYLKSEDSENKDITMMLLPYFKKEYLDYEGFIYYRKINDTKYDYSKVKHPYFNKLHKINMKNKDMLLNIPYPVNDHYNNLKKLKLMHTLFIPTIINIYNDLIKELNIDRKKSREYSDKLSELNKNRNNLGPIHELFMNIVVNNFKKINLYINLLVYGENLRKQGYVSLLYVYKDAIYEYDDSKPEWIPDNINEVIRNATLDSELYASSSLKLFYFICSKILKFGSLENNSKLVEYSNKIFKPFFYSSYIIELPLLPENIVKSENMFRLMTFNVLTSFEFLKEPKNSYGFKDITDEHQEELKDSKIINVINVIKKVNPDILLLQEIDKKWEQEKIITLMNEYNLVNTCGEDSLIQYKRRNVSGTWTHQDDGICIWYSKDKYNCLANYKGNFITDNVGNGSPYILTVLENKDSKVKHFIINIHVKIDDWNDPNYNIDTKIFPHIKNYIIEKGFEYLKTQGLTLNLTDVLIFGGDFNSYEFRFMREMKINPFTEELEESWSTKYSFNRRNWTNFKNMLIKEFNEKNIIHENNSGYITGTSCLSNLGGETDHIFSSSNLLKQHYHLDVKHLFRPLNPGCKEELIDSKKVGIKSLLKSIKSNHNYLDNQEQISKQTSVSDHYPKVVDLYYEISKSKLKYSNSNNNKFNGFEETKADLSKGTIFIIYYFSINVKLINKKIFEYFNSFDPEKYKTLFIKKGETKDLQELFDYDDDRDLICFINIQLNNQTNDLDSNLPISNIRINSKSFIKDKDTIITESIKVKNKKGVEVIRHKKTQLTINNVLDIKLEKYNIHSKVVSIPNLFLKRDNHMYLLSSAYIINQIVNIKKYNELSSLNRIKLYLELVLSFSKMNNYLEDKSKITSILANCQLNEIDLKFDFNLPPEDPDYEIHNNFLQILKNLMIDDIFNYKNLNSVHKTKKIVDKSNDKTFNTQLLTINETFSQFYKELIKTDGLLEYIKKFEINIESHFGEIIGNQIKEGLDNIISDSVNSTREMEGGNIKKYQNILIIKKSKIKSKKSKIKSKKSKIKSKKSKIKSKKSKIKK
jgi:hypothetical protein